MEELKALLQRLKDCEALKAGYERAEEDRARLQAVVAALDEGVISAKTDGTITDWNPAAEKIYGYPKEEILGRSLTLLFPRDNRHTVLAALSRSAGGECIEYHKTLGVRKDGRSIQVCLLMSPVRNLNGSITSVFSIVCDITQRRQAEAVTKGEEQWSTKPAELRSIYATVPIALCAVDSAFTYLSVNEQFAAMNGLSVEDHIGRTVGGPVPILTDRTETYLRHVLETREPVEGVEIHGRTLVQPAVERDWLAYFSPTRDEEGRLLGVNIALIEITERKRAEEMMQFQALHDTLTGLPNRMLFMDHLKSELAEARRNRKMLAVMFLDLDNFKNINDTLGHTIGDQLLKEVARRLSTCIRETDTMARIGGDEFNMVLPDIGAPESAVSIAKKIISLFVDPFLVEKEELLVTASIGISICPDDGEDAEELLKNADIAMYQAKERGGNKYLFYSLAMNRKTFERTLISNNLRKMVEHSELVLYYQPELNIDSWEVCCGEALVRWQHPELGLLSAAEFLPLAVETRVIASIDEWVLRTACAQAKTWQKTERRPLCVTVNLSARQLQQRNFNKILAQILDETGLDPKLLELDIAESAVMNNIESTLANLASLADIGIGISLDDFGSAFSCLGFLKKLPVRKLKIDRLFISDLKEDRAHQAIVNAVIEVAHKMNILVVAEGVETDEQLTFLRSKGCDEMLGYLFSRPLPGNKFEQLVMSPPPPSQ